MSNLYGLWASVAVYAAIGAIGLFFLTTQPRILESTDGYGTAAAAAHQ